MRMMLRAKPNKYGAKAAIGIDGFRYDSKAECKYGDMLVMAWRAKEIPLLLRQVPFHLPGGVIYRLDFLWVDDKHEAHFDDVKGFETKEFMVKKKLVESVYDIEITLVKAKK